MSEQKSSGLSGQHVCILADGQSLGDASLLGHALIAIDCRVSVLPAQLLQDAKSAAVLADVDCLVPLFVEGLFRRKRRVGVLRRLRKAGTAIVPVVRFSDIENVEIVPDDFPEIVAMSGALEDNGARDIAKHISAILRQRLFPQHPGLGDIPEPGAGIHVQLDVEGVLTFAPPADLDREGNNVGRLNSLHPVIRGLAETLVSTLSLGNKPHQNLLATASAYLSTVDQALPQIDFTLLYALGVRLANSAGAARAAIQNDDLPPLAADADEALQSLLDLHGTFVLASREGLELLDLEERLRLSPEQVRDLREAGLDFGALLRARPDLAKPEVAEAVVSTAELMGQGTNAARGTAVGVGTVQNTVVAVTVAASIATLPVAAVLLSSPSLAIGSGVIGLFGNESLKKSKAFVAITDEIRTRIDRLSEAETGQLLARLGDFLALVRNNVRVFERLSSGGQSMAWIRTAVRRLVGKGDR